MADIKDWQAVVMPYEDAQNFGREFTENVRNSLGNVRIPLEKYLHMTYLSLCARAVSAPLQQQPFILAEANAIKNVMIDLIVPKN